MFSLSISFLRKSLFLVQIKQICSRLFLKNPFSNIFKYRVSKSPSIKSCIFFPKLIILQSFFQPQIKQISSLLFPMTPPISSSILSPSSKSDFHYSPKCSPSTDQTKLLLIDTNDFSKSNIISHNYYL